MLVARSANAAVQCPPGTELSGLHLYGIPAAVIVLGATVMVVLFQRLKSEPSRATVIVAVLAITLAASFVALIYAGFSAPCVR